MATPNKFFSMPEDGEETVACPYNSSHVVPASMHSFHVRHCPQKNNAGQQTSKRKEKSNGRTQKEEDWEPDIVPGKPGYVPLMSMVRPVFREVHSMTQVQRRRYYDELLKQHKVVNMLKSLANKSYFAEQRRKHVVPSVSGQFPVHPQPIPTKPSTGKYSNVTLESKRKIHRPNDDLDDWYIEPMLTSLSSRLESILTGAERQPTSLPKYLSDDSWPKLNPPTQSSAPKNHPIQANHRRPSEMPKSRYVRQQNGTAFRLPSERPGPGSGSSATASPAAVSPASGDSAGEFTEPKLFPSVSGSKQRPANGLQQASTRPKISAFVSLRGTETSKWIRAGDHDDELFYCSGKGRGRVRT
ncbi:uncharacterized protein LOC135399917 [Ornithodoros turicata]|uniref:uncharacterized protein LOC135399917 n=1 Tax=Ornithodoros turicata TaxID=34597 RepID=UPI003139EF5B